MNRSFIDSCHFKNRKHDNKETMFLFYKGGTLKSFTAFAYLNVINTRAGMRNISEQAIKRRMLFCWAWSLVIRFLTNIMEVGPITWKIKNSWLAKKLKTILKCTFNFLLKISSNGSFQVYVTGNLFYQD